MAMSGWINSAVVLPGGSLVGPGAHSTVYRCKRGVTLSAITFLMEVLFVVDELQTDG